MKKNYNVVITILVVVVALVVTCIILYQKTEWFRRFCAWWVWLYKGLRTFNWGNFVYP